MGEWTDVHQEAFDNMKKLIAKETLLTYPDFNKPFEIHTDASDVQLGPCILQDGKPVAFYSRKLNPAQTRYWKENYFPLWKHSRNLEISF